MKIIKIKDTTKWLVCDTSKIVSPAGYKPSERVAGVADNVKYKEYTCETKAQLAKLVQRDFPGYAMGWDVEQHFNDQV